MEHDHLEYHSVNGYTGILYGKSSLIVLDAKGHNVMHTGRRSINSMDELKEMIDGYPEFIKVLRGE